MTAKPIKGPSFFLGQREKEQSVTWTGLTLRQPTDKQQRMMNQQDIPQCSVLRGRGKGQYEATPLSLTSVRTEGTDATFSPAANNAATGTFPFLCKMNKVWK